MDVPFVLALFLLSRLLLLPSFSAQEDNKIQITCPKSFDCESLHRPLEFPFSNSTKYSQCGLCMVTCDEPFQPPKIQLGNQGQWYNVVREENKDDTIQLQIYDPTLQFHLENRSCYPFWNWNWDFRNSPSISFTISPNLTFIRCDKFPNLVSLTDGLLNGFYNYTNCEHYNLYYKYPDDQNSSAPADLPLGCSVIHLPMNPSNTKPNVSDPFNLLVSTFSLKLHVSEDCQKCHLGGGQCQNDNQRFHCATDEGLTVVARGTHLVLILGTGKKSICTNASKFLHQIFM